LKFEFGSAETEGLLVVEGKCVDEIAQFAREVEEAEDVAVDRRHGCGSWRHGDGSWSLHPAEGVAIVAHAAYSGMVMLYGKYEDQWTV
jgi:hypothetical protein